MAAASVLEELQDEKIIDIEGIVGVSAGAIAACMLSSETRIDTYRGRVRDIGVKYIPHFSVKTETWMQRWKIIKKVINGDAIFDEKKLLAFFHEIFVDQDKKVETFDCLKIPTTIIASNLQEQEKISYGPTNVAGKKIINVLADSCALPFAFRTHKNGSVVDGGIVNNFPLDDALGGNQKAFVLGFSFKGRSNIGVSDPFRYGLSLLSTSIDSSVKENSERIKLLGGEVCQLNKNYGLIEFEKALNDGLDIDKFKEVKKAIRADVKESITKIKERAIVHETTDELRLKILTAYNFLDEHQPKTREVVSIIHGDGIYDDTAKDKSVTTLHIKPESQSMQVFSTGLAATSGPILRGHTDWSVENNSNSLNAEQKLVTERRKVPKGTEIMHKALFFFEKPFLKSEGTLDLVQESRGDFFGPLKKFDVDFVRHQSLAPHSASKVVQILILYPSH